MLLDFIPLKANCERILIDPMAIETVVEESLIVGGKVCKVLRIAMECGDKHMVFDEDRDGAERINVARLMISDPNAFEETAP